jgi:hypothetical protein
MEFPKMIGTLDGNENTHIPGVITPRPFFILSGGVHFSISCAPESADASKIGCSSNCYVQI